MAPRLIVILLTLLFLSVSQISASAQCATSTGESRFGVGDPLGWTGLYPRDRMIRALDMMADAGIHWVRLNWAWKDLQPQDGPFDYSHYDMIAELASERGIEILPILFAIPAWASTAPPDLIAERGNLSPVDRYRPKDMKTWLTYVQNVVERYDGDGIDDAPSSPRMRYWEVWNEENISLYWPPEPDDAEYIVLVQETRKEILAADPTAKIVLGGLAGGGSKFLESFYVVGASNLFDVVSIHSYSYPALGIAPLQATVQSVRDVMDANGDQSKPIWLTEVGWSDAPNAWGAPTASPDLIAEFLTSVYTTPLGADIIFWYNFRDIFADSDDVEHNFGLLEGDFTPKPAYEAYKAIAAGC